ncbi:hypothetical protein CFIO01_08422 [Colletotrichum fioriniae PJ7]|uniref:Uncharacterized protein n=1 Tax=Colletotrichum fioriniae PJ7 TaxID=1445577 RepID=A0A010Q558_9PEZI|nr:hypothetical protein CFIO01_08422 [Colletotrichum fioriniae PJ7]
MAASKVPNLTLPYLTVTRKVQRLYDWTDTQWKTDTNDCRGLPMPWPNVREIRHTGTCGGSLEQNGHRPSALGPDQKPPPPLRAFSDPPEIGNGPPGSPHVLNWAWLGYIHFVPHLPSSEFAKRHRKVLKEVGNRGPRNLTRRHDTSPSSHALSSGPHDRDCSRCCTLCTSAPLPSSPPPPDRPSFRPATRDWIEPHALCNTSRPELAFARPVVPLASDSTSRILARLVSTLHPSSFSAQYPSIGLFGPWIDPRTLANQTPPLAPPSHFLLGQNHIVDFASLFEIGVCR